MALYVYDNFALYIWSNIPMVPIKSLTNGIVCPPFGYTMMKLKLVTNPSLKSHLVRNIYYYLVLQFLKPSGLVGWLVGWLVGLD